MEKNIRLFTLILSISLLINNSIQSDNDDHKVPFPHLMYMTPREPGQFTLNERNSFTQELNSGWILKENQKIEFLFYLFVQEKITKLSDIAKSYVYFTSNKNQCNISNQEVYDEKAVYSEDTDFMFQLKFLDERSKLYQKNSNLIRRRSKIHRITKRGSLDETSDSLDDDMYYNNNTLLVGHAVVQLKYDPSKYYVCVHFATKQQAKKDSALHFVHQGGKKIWTNVITTQDMLPIWAVIIFYFGLLMLSSLCSGLNLGLMSLDLSELSLLKKIGSASEKIHAKKIYPLRAHGNLLLCSILLGNVLVNTISTLILGSYLDGLLAAIGSTMFIVIFGEIIPQALCSRYGLWIGAKTRFIMYGIMGFVFIVAFPMSKLLNLILGKEISTIYTRDKIRELMRRAKDGKDIEEKQFKLISGALDFKSKKVETIMTPTKDVFALDINVLLDFDTFKLILYHGYSRIPVYEFTRENLVGVILIQDLLLNDPSDRVPLRAVMEYFKHPLLRCKTEDSLETMFDKFRKGSHMAFVYKNAEDIKADEEIVEAVGILTMEDIIEELVQSEIMDEADTKRERRRKRAKQFLTGKLANVSLSNDNLNIFVNEVDQTTQPVISSQIRKALFYFLASSVKPFSGEFINPKLLETFLRKPELTKEKRNLVEDESDINMYLYKYGVECDYFIIILEGKAVLQVGKEGMEVDAGLFSYYGVDSLVDENAVDPLKTITDTYKPYKPEFSLKVNSYCVYLQITRNQWKEAVKQSMIERNLGLGSTNPLNSIEQFSGVGSSSSLAKTNQI